MKLTLGRSILRITKLYKCGFPVYDLSFQIQFTSLLITESTKKKKKGTFPNTVKYVHIKL